MSSPTDPITTRNIVKQLLDTRDKLVLERLEVRQTLLQWMLRDAQLNKKLTDLVAAGRVFDAVIAVPTDLSAYASLEALMKHMSALRANKEWKPGESMPVSKDEPGQKEDRGDAEISAPETIRDRVLAYLERAGNQGSKAAPIRKYLFDTYGQETHEKTVGMTLYRLLKDGAVKRTGHTWFFVPLVERDKNPGGETPGLFNRDDR